MVSGTAAVYTKPHTFELMNLPVTLDFLVRTKDKYPLGKIMSHSFSLEDITDAFRQSEWLGKEDGSKITRAFVKP